MNIQKNTPKSPKGDFCSAEVLLLGVYSAAQKAPFRGLGVNINRISQPLNHSIIQN